MRKPPMTEYEIDKNIASHKAKLDGLISEQMELMNDPNVQRFIAVQQMIETHKGYIENLELARKCYPSIDES